VSTAIVRDRFLFLLATTIRGGRLIKEFLKLFLLIIIVGLLWISFWCISTASLLGNFFFNHILRLLRKSRSLIIVLLIITVLLFVSSLQFLGRATLRAALLGPTVTQLALLGLKR